MPHKSYKDGNVTIQMLTYVLEIWRKKGKIEKLPIVFPIVFYHGKEKWKGNLSLEDKIYGYDELSAENKKYVPRYEVFLFNVSDLTDEEIKGVAKLKWTLILFRDIMRVTGELLEKRLVSIYREVHEDEEYYLSVLTYVVNVKEDFNKENIRVITQ
ncbi:MAG: Rpn family recombination-promoting nuclease/putative transposase, partial [Bacillota bacterium]|nr:Rpn family recombination-promoting nuclease/putative transposase [Bacillota bacterium]